MINNQAILDCRANKLSHGGAEVRITMDNQCNLTETPVVLPVQVMETIEVPSHSVMLIQAVVKDQGIIYEVLLEPTYSSNPPKHLFIARSVRQNHTMLAQVVNISCKLHKGMSVGGCTCSGGGQEVDILSYVPGTNDFDPSQSNLTGLEKVKLAELINEFTDLFSGELGCTSVVQQILTEGSPSRQPVRCVPVALQEVVNAEVSKMHEQGVMWLSHSPGLLLMISES